MNRQQLLLALCFSTVALACNSPAPEPTAVVEEPASDSAMSDTERQEALEALADSLDELEELVAEVSAADWSKKPAEDKWSIGEVAEHLLITERVIFASIEEMLAGDPNPDWESATAGKMERIAQFMPDRTTKAQAPDMVQPSGAMAREDCLNAFRAARAKTTEFMTSTEAALHEYTAPHPAEFFGEMNAYQWVHFIAAHNRRHNQQIAEVRDTLGI